MSLPRAVAWWLDPDAEGLPSEVALVAELGEEERARLSRRIRPEARRRFLASRALLRRALGLWLGVRPTQVRLSGGAGAPLRLAAPAEPLHVSVSHTPGLVACAVGEVGVGVDVESRVRSVRSLRLAERFFAPPEAAWVRAVCGEAQRERFLALWTAKEAALKSRGQGLGGGLAGARVVWAREAEARVHLGGRVLALGWTLAARHRLALVADHPDARLDFRPGRPLFGGGRQAGNAPRPARA